MGLDLTIAPIHGGPKEWWLASNRLRLDRDYELFEAIRRQPCHELPSDVKFDWLGDDGLEQATTDPYGSPLTYIRAIDLAKVVALDSSAWNQAVFSMVKNLHYDMPIVLWWC